MKISKQLLKRIIKQEKSRVLSEQIDPMEKLDAQDIIDGFYNTINQLVHEEWAAAGVDPYGDDSGELEYIKEALRRLLTDLEKGQF